MEARLALKQERDRLGRRFTRAQEAEERRQSAEARRDAGLMSDYAAAVKKYFLPIIDLAHIRPLDFLDEFGFELKTFIFGYDLMKGLKDLMSPEQLKRAVDIEYDQYFTLQDEEEKKR